MYGDVNLNVPNITISCCANPGTRLMMVIKEPVYYVHWVSWSASAHAFADTIDVRAEDTTMPA